VSFGQGRGVTFEGKPGMTRLILAAFAALAVGGCDAGTSPSAIRDTYALARIGLEKLPIAQGESGGAPFLLADTLRLGGGRPRDAAGPALTRIVVFGDQDHIDYRLVSEHSFAIENGMLTYDSCPRGSFCIEALVYAPLVFQIVGDSLFQIMPQGSPIPGAVYGAVARRR